MHRLFEQISLTASFPAILISLLVVFLWGRAAWETLFKEERGSHDYFILGVSVSFIFGSLDALYWMVPWSLDYAGSHQADAWFKAGVYANVPFRQGGDLLAAGLHVASFVIYNRNQGVEHPAFSWFVQVLVLSTLIGVMFTYFIS